MNLKLGSLFSGIGGFELGLHRSIPNLETVWQVEQDKFCQKILNKHWPNSQIYNDITTINTEELESVDILCAGFPCQDISVAGKQEGINGKKSGLFWEMWRIIRDFREQGRTIPLLLLENVPAITTNGLGHVLGAIFEIGYDAEWFVISAGENFGAPHLRKRWFLVAYPNENSQSGFSNYAKTLEGTSSDSYGIYAKISTSRNISTIQKFRSHGKKGRFWKESPIESPLCSVDDGIPNRVARLRALGNAIVPQCSEWIGQQIIKSGLLEDLFYAE
tara:strand:- start:2398 stop:3222 length:825 start_codon:yes stop_codon:yes gene_type:complete